MRTFIFLLILLLIPGALAEVSEHAGFPIQSPVSITNAITIADINNDTVPEIVVATLRSAYVYSPTGNLLWKAVAGDPSTAVTTSPLVADVNGDGLKEIVLPGGVFGSAGSTSFIHRFYIFSSSGGVLKTYELGSGYYPSVPAFADGLILVGITGNFNGLYAYDMAGLKWAFPFPGGSERMNSIAVGDLDGDGTSEAVFAGGGKVTAVTVTASGGNLMWQKDVPGAISPVIINVSGNKRVVASGSSGTFAWDAAGTPVWSSNAGSKYYYYAYSSPAVSDLNNDGSDDVIIVNDFDVYAISGVDGTILFKTSSVTWPPGGFKSRPAVYDINGDSSPEIIIGDSNGNLYIWKSTGTLLEGFPVRITDRVKPLYSSPSVSDLEGDGIPEVVIGSATHLHVVSVIIKRDTTPAVTTDDVDGVWRNSNVTVTLTANDEESGVAATYYTIDGREPTKDSASGNTFTLSADGVYTIRYFSVDKAGNIESIKTASNNVKIDKMPPSTTDNADGLWHKGSVLVTLTANDGEGSGIAATYYTVDGFPPSSGTSVAISSEGIHTIKYYSVDNAGNKEDIREAVVRIDSTPPATTDDSDNRWHNSGVTLNLAASDNLSGVAFIRYRADGVDSISYSANVQLTFADEGVHTVEYYSVDSAGNTEETKNAHVKIDKTPPVTTDDADGLWHNNSLTVNLLASDNLAGINSTYYKVSQGTQTAIEAFFSWLGSVTGLIDSRSMRGEAVSISDEGIFVLRYYSVDNADNKEPEKTSQQVKIDKTAPVITGNTDKLPNNNGWYSSDVTIHFDCTDSLSGVESCTPDSIVSNEGAGQSVSGAAVDKAGNSANAVVEGINVDKTKPTLTVNSPQNKTYLHSDIITQGFAAQDELSGIKTVSSAIDGAVQVSDGQAFDMLALNFGAHEFYISAEDNSGNLNSRKVSFNVIATIDSLSALTERGSTGAAVTGGGSSGVWITSNGVASSLKAKLNSARAKMDKGQNTAAKNILEAYVNEVEAQAGKAITSEGAGILRAEAKYVIEHL